MVFFFFFLPGRCKINMNVLCTFLQEEVGGIENFLYNLQFDDFDGMDGTDDDDDDDDDDDW